MTKVAVWIPTHLYYNGQIDYLSNCIESLLKQSKRPDIFVSVSFENESYKRAFASILLKYGKIDEVNFKLSKERLYQMEHIYNILSKTDINQYEMIMFCDDDDTYNNKRVEIFIEVYEHGKNCGTQKFGGVREVHADVEIEYWAYGVKPDVLTTFFSKLQGNKHILQHKFGDMFLRKYLRWNTKYYNWVSPKGVILYNYNITNPNSICAVHNNNPSYDDSLFLKILNCRNDHDFANIYQTEIIPSKIINNKEKRTLMRNGFNLFTVCKSLYV